MGNQEWTIQRHWRHWEQDEYKQNRMGNQEWTIQRHWRHWEQDEYKQN